MTGSDSSATLQTGCRDDDVSWCRRPCKLSTSCCRPSDPKLVYLSLAHRGKQLAVEEYYWVDKVMLGMCLRDPFRRNSPGDGHHHHQKSTSRLQLHHPKLRVIKIHRFPSAHHHHHHPAIKSLIGSATFSVQDLLCAEALSISPTSTRHLAPAIARRHRASHGLHHYIKCNITKCIASSQIRSTVNCSFTINPSRNPGSSFQSKIIDLFPCYLNPRKIVLSRDEHRSQPRFRVDDTSSSSEISADSDLDEAGKDSGVNAAATVGDEIISAKNMANVLEFEEAMGVLRKREAKVQYKLTHHYVHALMHHHHHHSPNSTNSVLMNLGSARRHCVLLIFKVPTKFGLLVMSPRPLKSLGNGCHADSSIRKVI